jgi:hypothetical protein
MDEKKKLQNKINKKKNHYKILLTFSLPLYQPVGKE